MQKFFGIESREFSVVTKIVDLGLLNIIFLISCLPIVTIGPAITALYSITLKMAYGNDYYVLKDFVKSFKKNFLQSSLLSGIIGIIVVIIMALGFTANEFGQNNPIALFPVMILVAISCLTLMYVFPLLAKFENTNFNILKNAYFISFQFAAHSILLFIITIFFVGVIPIFLPNLLLAWILFGCAMSAYLKSIVLKKIFNNYLEEQTN